jgi:hypothetical protein
VSDSCSRHRFHHRSHHHLRYHATIAHHVSPTFDAVFSNSWSLLKFFAFFLSRRSLYFCLDIVATVVIVTIAARCVIVAVVTCIIIAAGSFDGVFYSTLESSVAIFWRDSRVFDLGVIVRFHRHVLDGAVSPPLKVFHFMTTESDTSWPSRILGMVPPISDWLHASSIYRCMIIKNRPRSNMVSSVTTLMWASAILASASVMVLCVTAQASAAVIQAIVLTIVWSLYALRRWSLP